MRVIPGICVKCAFHVGKDIKNWASLKPKETHTRVHFRHKSLSAWLFLSLALFLPFSVSVCLSVSLPVCLSLLPCLCLSDSVDDRALLKIQLPSVHLPVCLSVCMSVSLLLGVRLFVFLILWMTGHKIQLLTLSPSACLSVACLAVSSCLALCLFSLSPSVCLHACQSPVSLSLHVYV